MYFRPETGEIFAAHSDIRSAMPNVLFPSSITDDDLAYSGVFPLVHDRPEASPGQIAVPLAIENIEGDWTQLWTMREATPEELTVNAAATEEARLCKNAEIDRWRAEANASTFPHGGKLIACDALSRSDIDGVANHIALCGGFPDGFPGGWKATDKTMLPLPDVDAFRAMFASMTAQGTENFNHSQDLKAQLAAASTPEEIAAIQW